MNGSSIALVHVAAGGGGCALANGLVETLISGGGGAGERLVENGDDAEAGAAESAEKRNANSSTSCSDGAVGAWGGAASARWSRGCRATVLC